MQIDVKELKELAIHGHPNGGTNRAGPANDPSRRDLNSQGSRRSARLASQASQDSTLLTLAAPGGINTGKKVKPAWVNELHVSATFNLNAY